MGEVAMNKGEKITKIVVGIVMVIVILWLSWSSPPTKHDGPPPYGSWTTGPDVRNGVVQDNYRPIPRGSWTTGPDVRNGVVQ
jgi:hypothetical protein